MPMGGGTRRPSALRVHCSGVNLYAPWLVPIEMASESQPVRVAKSMTSSGSVYVWWSLETSVLNAGQYAKFTFNSNVILVSVVYDLFVRATFSSVGRWLPSIITDEKPLSMHDLHSLKAVAMVEVEHNLGCSQPSSLAYATAPWAM